jgi:hypothetical protein
MKEGQHTTSCIKHLAVSGLSIVSTRIKGSCNLIGNRFEMPNVSYTQPLPTRRRNDRDTENDRINGLRMKNNDMKEKRFSFFADPQERKAESRPTFGTLPFARHTSQRFAKVKEPNFADTHQNIELKFEVE